MTNHETVTMTGRHCAWCGRTVDSTPAAPERFGEPFCSDGHAEEFVAEVRAARQQAIARAAAGGPGNDAPAPAPRWTWPGALRRGACWGTPLLLLLAVPLLWSGGVAAAGGSLIALLAALACPLGMYFMMRTMARASHHQTGAVQAPDKEDSRA